MPEENQRITREHLPGLLLARAIWERGPSLYFPPALKTATDQARACSLEMKTHCVELYRDAPELHEVVLASEALAACAARDARIVELESGQSADMFLTLTGEITQLRAELAAIKAQEPTGWYTEGHLDDKSATTYSLAVAERWVEKGWPVSPLYAAPVSEAKAQGVVLTDEELCSIRNQVACNEVRLDDDSRTICVKHGRALEAAVLARITAAPAAPAADAGIVDMYRHLQKVTPYRFKKIQDASITDGGDVMYFHKDRFDAALLADMAAHSANGVV